MRKEMFPLGWMMCYYSTDMPWKNTLTVIFLFLICNFSFSAVTGNDYGCSFVKMNTWLFSVAKYPLLARGKFTPLLFGDSPRMLTLSIKHYWPFLATSRDGNPPHLLPMKHNSGAQHWRPDGCGDAFVNIEADPSPCCIQLRICHNKAAWTLKYVECSEAALSAHTHLVLSSENTPVSRMAGFSTSLSIAMAGKLFLYVPPSSFLLSFWEVPPQGLLIVLPAIRLLSLPSQCIRYM